MIKTKVLPPQVLVTLQNFAILFRSFACIAPKDIKSIWLSNLSVLRVLDGKEFEDTKGR